MKMYLVHKDENKRIFCRTKQCRMNSFSSVFTLFTIFIQLYCLLWKLENIDKNEATQQLANKTTLSVDKN